MICLKIRTFVVSATTPEYEYRLIWRLWFAWKFVPLWYQQQRVEHEVQLHLCCDLLENSYLCGISNNAVSGVKMRKRLWFAWKFVPLWYQQQQRKDDNNYIVSCDLLENSYLCGISNNNLLKWVCWFSVVICLKIRTFVVSATTNYMIKIEAFGCDLLENSYLCGISNNVGFNDPHPAFVVICLKIRTFVVSATTVLRFWIINYTLWFAWKFVPLWYQQQQMFEDKDRNMRCDLLENSYLCGISNNLIL